MTSTQKVFILYEMFFTFHIKVHIHVYVIQKKIFYTTYTHILGIQTNIKIHVQYIHTFLYIHYMQKCVYSEHIQKNGFPAWLTAKKRQTHEKSGARSCIHSSQQYECKCIVL